MLKPESDLKIPIQLEKSKSYKMPKYPDLNGLLDLIPTLDKEPSLPNRKTQSNLIPVKKLSTNSGTEFKSEGSC